MEGSGKRRDFQRLELDIVRSLAFLGWEKGPKANSKTRYNQRTFTSPRAEELQHVNPIECQNS